MKKSIHINKIINVYKNKSIKVSGDKSLSIRFAILASLAEGKSKAKNLLNWKPKVDFDGLVKLMVEEDIELAKQEKTLLDNNLIKPTWENAI